MFIEVETIGEIIAERQYHFDAAPGANLEITSRLGSPREHPDRRRWYCPYEIAGITHGKPRLALGRDSLEAIQVALLNVLGEVYMFSRFDVAPGSSGECFLGQEEHWIREIEQVTEALA